MNQKILISIIGATGIGKTALSIELAEYFQTEILSCDSRQFYKEMNIGTAVPSKDELAQVNHHFIQNRSIFEDYNVGSFEKDALLLLEQLFVKKDIMIMVGGSGLYVDAVLKGLDDFPEVNPDIRKNLIFESKEKGLEGLQTKLKELDPSTYQKIDINNHQRLIRALEICLGTGQPFSSFLSAQKKKRPFKSVKIGISADREIIYNRINKRVDQMVAAGLVKEAKTLYPNKSLNALQTVGYRELFSYFDGMLSLEEAISEIKKNSRRFAKRQTTWFKRDTETTWFDYETDPMEITDFIEKCT